MKSVKGSIVALLGIGVTISCVAGCETSRGTGTLAGAGVGALMGQAIGGNTRSTLIGAGVGAAGGYIIGSEMDHRRAAQQQGAELRPLAGTSWTLLTISPESARTFSSMIIDFRQNGTVMTKRTALDGTVRVDEEHFRIVNSTLIVNDRDYIINGSFLLQDRTLTFIVGDVTSRWARIGG